MLLYMVMVQNMTVYNSYQYYPLIGDINYIFNFLLKMLKLKKGLK